MVEDLRLALKPGARVLDAGAGTGALSRRVLELEPRAQLTLLDISPAMLARAADVPGERVESSLLELPLAARGLALARAGSAWLRAAIKRGFAGEFLPEQRTPWHDCGFSHRRRFAHGLTTEVGLRSCCQIGEELLAPVAATAGGVSP